MDTKTLTVNPLSPEPAFIARAAEVLRRGGLVAFPTETVYGLGANALDSKAVDGIFRAKGRPSNNPLIVHVATPTAAEAVTSNWSDAASKLAARFWPGPLTLVLPRAKEIALNVTAGGPTVAVRVPAHPVAQALLRATGLPIAAPSANRSNEISPTRAEHVARSLTGRIDMLLDGGPTQFGLESTVVDLSRSPPRLLRPGSISRAELELILGPIVTHSATSSEPTAPLPSPGMLARHYSPRTPLTGVEGDGRPLVEQYWNAGTRIGWLTRGPAHSVPPGLFVISLPDDPVRYAAQLYDALHQLDAVALDRIVVDLPPPTDEWLAVRDRLLRASG